MNQHEIKTINDIYRAVTPDNMEGFLTDFEMWLRMVIELKKTDPERTVIDIEKFTWMDDGENGKVRGIHITPKDVV